MLKAAYENTKCTTANGVYSHVGCAWAPTASASSPSVKGSRALPYRRSRAPVKPPSSLSGRKKGARPLYGWRVPTSTGNVRFLFSLLFQDEGKGRRCQSSSVLVSRQGFSPRITPRMDSRTWWRCTGLLHFEKVSIKKIPATFGEQNTQKARTTKGWRGSLLC